MSKLKENQLAFVNEKGEEVLCDILFTYDSDEFKKSYVFFAPLGITAEDEKLEVHCASYVPLEDGEMGELSEVETQEEWEMLEEVFNDYASQFEKIECGCEDEDCSTCSEHCGCHHDDEDEDK